MTPHQPARAVRGGRAVPPTTGRHPEDRDQPAAAAVAVRPEKRRRVGPGRKSPTTAREIREGPCPGHRRGKQCLPSGRMSSFETYAVSWLPVGWPARLQPRRCAKGESSRCPRHRLPVSGLPFTIAGRSSARNRPPVAAARLPAETAPFRSPRPRPGFGGTLQEAFGAPKRAATIVACQNTSGWQGLMQP